METTSRSYYRKEKDDEKDDEFNKIFNHIGSIPFILRQPNFLECLDLEFSERIIREEKIFGYMSSLDWKEETFSGKDLWNIFQRGILDINIVDSPATEWLPLNIKEYFEQKLGENSQYGLTWILTQAPKITHFHTDPEYAGRYMKLLKGEKIWWCIIHSDWEYLESKGHSYDSLRELDLTQILSLENYFLMMRFGFQ